VVRVTEHYELVFERYLVRIPDGTPAILTEVLRNSPHSVQANARIACRSGQDRLFLNETRLSLCVVLATRASYGLHAGTMKFNTQTEEGISICIIIYTVLMCVYLYISWNKMQE
jgi:hypothetical protein